MKTPLPIILLLLFTSFAVRASNIISVTGTTPNGQYTFPVTSTDPALGVSWTSTTAFSNVTISLSLGSSGTASATAYLTTQIGLGTTLANELASTIFNFPLSDTPSFTIFTGLTLPAGTYYLTLGGLTSGAVGAGLWDGTPSPSVATDSGVTRNFDDYPFAHTASYLPANISGNTTLNLKYSVAGTAVPEPTTTLMLILGGCFLVLARRRLTSARACVKTLGRIDG